VSYIQVDYQGNKNLLDSALEASARKFIFIHAFNAPLLRFFDGMKAKEKFVDELSNAPITRAVVCPNGFYNDMTEFLKMAKRGTVYLIGDGHSKINPIHGADLAKVCVDAVAGDQAEIPVGGPITYTYREIAEIAFAALGRPVHIRRVPVWVANLMVSLLRPFSRTYYTLAAGMTTIAQNDFVAPPFGTHSLKEYYEQIAPTL
jgi:uncharacterized protein YbjT (DUF2867 family)